MPADPLSSLAKPEVGGGGQVAGGESFRTAAEQLATQLSVLSFKQEKRAIPLTQVR